MKPGFQQTQPLLACDLSAFDAAQRTRHRDLLRRVIRERLELRELANGYAFAFPADANIATMLSEYIVLERLCCPFLNLSLIFEAKPGPLWLEVTSENDAKPLIAASFEAVLSYKVLPD